MKKMSNLTQTVIHQIHEVAQKHIPKNGQVMLYGSRARGDAHKGSDWDLLVVLDLEEVTERDYKNYIYPFTVLGWDINQFIIPVVYTKDEWERNRLTPFRMNVEQDAIRIL